MDYQLKMIFQIILVVGRLVRADSSRALTLTGAWAKAIKLLSLNKSELKRVMTAQS